MNSDHPKDEQRETGDGAVLPEMLLQFVHLVVEGRGGV